MGFKETAITKRHRTKNLEKRRKTDRQQYRRRSKLLNKIKNKRRKTNPNVRHKYLIQQKTYKKYDYKPSCEICGLICKVQHHHFTRPAHEDYFIDLCINCHSIVERYDDMTKGKNNYFTLNNSENHNQPLSIGEINADVFKCSERSVGKKDKTPSSKSVKAESLDVISKEEDRGSNICECGFFDTFHNDLTRRVIRKNIKKYGQKFQPKDEVKG